MGAFDNHEALIPLIEVFQRKKVRSHPKAAPLLILAGSLSGNRCAWAYGLSAISVGNVSRLPDRATTVYRPDWPPAIGKPPDILQDFRKPGVSIFLPRCLLNYGALKGSVQA